MTKKPISETPSSTQAVPKDRWIEPEIDVLAIEQTETLYGHGGDTGMGAPDCTRS
ncbi:MAG: hypothetical protein WA280_04750 [Xanthobacteraceae bacterium]